MVVNRGCTEKIFILIFLLFAGLSDVSLAGVTVNGSLCADFGTISSADQISVISDPVSISGPWSASLAQIGAEFLKAPTAEDVAINLTSVVGASSGHKVMPAAPAPFLLVLTGFLCISLVRDRKTWLAACVGLVFLGQLGISALPKLVENLTSTLKPTRISSAVSLPASRSRIRSEVEGTRYIALLRKLAGIPDNKRFSSFNMTSNTDTVCDLILTAQQDLTYNASAFAAYISNLLGYNKLSPCLARSFRQSLAFSPALVISNLPHGPPA